MCERPRFACDPGNHAGRTWTADRTDITLGSRNRIMRWLLAKLNECVCSVGMSACQSYTNAQYCSCKRRKRSSTLHDLVERGEGIRQKNTVGLCLYQVGTSWKIKRWTHFRKSFLEYCRISWIPVKSWSTLGHKNLTYLFLKQMNIFFIITYISSMVVHIWNELTIRKSGHRYVSDILRMARCVGHVNMYRRAAKNVHLMDDVVMHRSRVNKVLWHPVTLIRAINIINPWANSPSRIR